MFTATHGILNQKSSFPLDLVSNTNLIVANSLRKLKSSFNGNVVQVRRSSDNGLNDFGTVNGDFDNTSLISYISSNTGTIRLWYNQAGLPNTYDFVQGTNINQPIIRLIGSSYFINSRPVISGYAPNSSYLQTSNILNLINGTDFTLIMVCTVGGAANGYARWFGGRSQNQFPLDYQSGGCSITEANATNTISFTGGNNQYCFPNNTFGNVVGNVVFTVYTNSTSATVRVNGGLSYTNNFTTNFSVDALSLFSAPNNGNNSNQKIGEVIAFKRTLSLSEIQLIEKNMGAYYGITVT